ncbi:small nuclear ribonucleoprotein hPrp3 [Ephemerocybe angulata]|uniref:Small nuclear ribonucleoprotein hPrp3 n=1 Tax=Ephemerocybe angulata TaxID=980116 RepID=A0A8H6HIR1_9AGAR|nr:small nuclear ribonucleoprotein hPrp3 [Tulosesus angulatus]
MRCAARWAVHVGLTFVCYGQRAHHATSCTQPQSSFSSTSLKSSSQLTHLPQLSADQLIAQKRAEINAKLLAMKNLGSQTRGTAPAPPSTHTTLPARPAGGIAAPTPKVPLAPPSSASRVVLGGAPTPPSQSSAPTPTEEIARKVAEAKRRVAEAQSKLAVKDNPYMALASSRSSASHPNASAHSHSNLNSGYGSRRPSSSATPVGDSGGQRGAGLGMAAHPLLLDQTPILNQSKKDRYKPMQPKFASIKANVRNAIATPPPLIPSPSPSVSANPYTAGASAAGGGAGGGAGAGGGGGEEVVFEGAPRERSGRGFRFNPRGKYVAMANQMRADQQLEDLKQRIAESARKAGLDAELGIEKSIKRAPPPAAEWWDSSLLPNGKYDDIEEVGLDALPIRTQDSPITIYVQHPIPIPAPGDKNKAVLKPLMLTTKEQKKMRKLRRKEALQDKRDRIRMGLLPPDPPKVRLANLMRVLTSDAVQDPTRVEARVRREVAMRKHGHEKANAERKLTEEQRREKKESKKAGEERKGIYGAVYKIKTLSDPAHQFKVRKNADQLNLTGLCIFNPSFNMVYVEGAPKFMKNYKRLMLHRIAWTEAARPRNVDDVELQSDAGDEKDDGKGEDKEDGEGAGEGLEDPESDVDLGNEEEGVGASSAGGKGKGKGKEGGEGDAEKSLEDNRCDLVWEGALRERAFSGFKARSCVSDRDAKDALGERMKGYWDMAKNWRGEEEELF